MAEAEQEEEEEEEDVMEEEEEEEEVLFMYVPANHFLNMKSGRKCTFSEYVLHEEFSAIPPSE